MMRLIVPWLAAAVSGILLALSFPPFALWPLAWLALVPLWIVVLKSDSAKAAVNLGAVTGLVFYCWSLSWMRGIFGPFAAAFWCVFALWIAFHAGLLKWIWDRRSGHAAGGLWPAAFACATGVFWTGFEYFRSEVWPLQNTFLALGFSQAPAPALLEFCSTFGLYGLSSLLAGFNMAAALVFFRRRLPAALAAAALAVLCAWGAMRPGTDVSMPGHRPLRVALVQHEGAAFARLSSLSMRARAPDLVVWPEDSFPVSMFSGKQLSRILDPFLKGCGGVKVIGAYAAPNEIKARYEHGEWQNFAWVFHGDGRAAGRYDKHHPIPYVEKFLEPNKKPAPVDTEAGRLGIQICYDLDFEDGPRLVAEQGAEVLVVPNMDPMRWGEKQHAQHAAMAPARAVETGLWVVKASSSGPSLIIDPHGRIRSTLASGKEGVLEGEVFLKKGGTFYTRCGWLWGPCCLVLLILTLAWAGFIHIRRFRG